MFWWCLLLTSVFSASSSSADHAWLDLFNACFDQKENLDRSMFFVKGYDDKLNRDVTLAFHVGRGGSLCDLRWNPPHFPGSHSQIIDKITGEKIINPRHRTRQTGIGMSFTKGIADKAWWNLDHLYPNGFVSGSFIRTFIVNRIKEISMKYLHGKPIPLKLIDQSKQYWLEQGNGMTYYEGFWNLRYECLLWGTENKDYDEIILESVKAQDEPVFPVFVRSMPVFGTSHFSSLEKFHRALSEWKRTKTETELSNMMKREVLKEFMPFWKASIRDDANLHQHVAQHVFEYFFQHDSNYYQLKKHVLHQESQHTCMQMTGYPFDTTSRVLNYEFHPQFLPMDFLESQGEMLALSAFKKLRLENVSVGKSILSFKQFLFYFVHNFLYTFHILFIFISVSKNTKNGR